MYFNNNFSEALQNRVQDFSFAEPNDILHGTIDIFLDMGGMYIYIYFVFHNKLLERNI